MITCLVIRAFIGFLLLVGLPIIITMFTNYCYYCHYDYCSNMQPLLTAWSTNPSAPLRLKSLKAGGRGGYGFNALEQRICYLGVHVVTSLRTPIIVFPAIAMPVGL